MRATLTIIRGGPKQPSAMLAFEEELTAEQLHHLRQQFDRWWDQGGVFMLQAVALSVADINLDVGSSGVTIIPRP